ncbi:MAG TPA: phosphatase PAP2 family protein [Pseudonocardiaceae bacterium]
MLKWLRRVIRKINEADTALVRRSARLPRSGVDPGLKTLTTAADHSMVWFAIAAALATRRGVTRRAALRGVAAVGAASCVTNLVAKPLFPRRRPPAELMPVHRRLTTPPGSSSFPSGHAASAAAFTTAVALEKPVAGALLVPLATAVAYSRVHTGVHWPSDVVAGLMLGVGTGLATTRWWPVRPETPALARPGTRVDRLPLGEGLVVLVNPASGDPVHDPGPQLAAHWPAATLVYPGSGTDLADRLEGILAAGDGRVRAVGVAGGDGSVAAAATVAARHELPLVVVPTGTLNHFARDLGVTDPADSVAAVRSGMAVRVDLGTVWVDGAEQYRFVNTASLGGYPEMVRLRERWAPRWGRWPAATAALLRVLAEARPLTVLLDGKEHRVWLLFVGNGGYQPKGFAPSWRPRLDDGLLDIRYVRADVPLSRLRFATAALTGALFRSRTYVQQEQQHLTVEVLGDPVALACDGEVRTRGRTFVFTARETTLTVYRPAGAERG